MSRVEILGVLTDIWAGFHLYRFHYRKLKPLRNNASPSNTSNAHISRTTTHTPKISSPICPPCPCSHFDIFNFEMLNVFHSEFPKVEFYAFSRNQLVGVSASETIVLNTQAFPAVPSALSPSRTRGRGSGNKSMCNLSSIDSGVTGHVHGTR